LVFGRLARDREKLVNPQVALIVQARTTSSRLPGKVLLPLAGHPAIVRIMERATAARRVSRCIVATSVESSDDELAKTCASRGFEVLRGPLDDVLGRFVAAAPENCPVLVRITADCPLVDPALVDRHVARFVEEQPWAEYVTNAVVRTQPDGLDVEVFSRKVLLEANRSAKSPTDREHVLPWVRRHARHVPVTQETDLSALRWTLDTPADYGVISAMYEDLAGIQPRFSTGDVYRLLLRRPELIHVAGRDALTNDERRTWVGRIEEHLATETGR
jgi:spore coat polysaccharide biosynthesis protein SpsF